VLKIAPWNVELNGVYLTRGGNIRLMVEKVGANFRVLVTRDVDETQPEEVVYAGTAANADDGMAIAERMAEQASLPRLPFRLISDARAA
jgi:hypothetical protein